MEEGGKMNGQGGREKCGREWAYEKESMWQWKPGGTFRDAAGKESVKRWEK